MTDVCLLFSFVYKLTDFGTARELKPDQEFTSIHGTEEYLVRIISFVESHMVYKFILVKFWTLKMFSLIVYT